MRGLTFGALLTSRWLPGRRITLAATTYDGYRRNVERHVVPALGRVGLRRLRPHHLEALYDRLLHPADGSTPLAPKTVYEIHLVIRGALADAVRRGLITRNVALVAHAPRLRSIPKIEQQSWTAPELKQFLRTAAGHRHFPALWVSAFTGMRRNELLGLKWDDYDDQAATISINRGPVSVDYELHETRGKTANARRRIDLDSLPSTSSRRGDGGNRPSSGPQASQAAGGCSPTPTASPSIPTRSRRASNASPDAPHYGSSARTTFATRMGRCSSPLACP